MTGDRNKLKDLSDKYALNDIINEFLDVRSAKAANLSDANLQAAGKSTSQSDKEY